jgi:hypothetical protein
MSNFEVLCIIIASAAVIYCAALYLEHVRNKEVEQWNSTRK